jgi:hypothetical protein
MMARTSVLAISIFAGCLALGAEGGRAETPTEQSESAVTPRPDRPITPPSSQRPEAQAPDRGASPEARETPGCPDPRRKLELIV